MEKYKDVPMDFADFTLVVLAEKMGVEEIFTLDNRGRIALPAEGPLRYGRRRQCRENSMF